MNEFLAHIETWKITKTRIIASEGYRMALSAPNATSNASRYLEIESGTFIARATVWEFGELDIEALSKSTGMDLLRKTFVANSASKLEDELNWWLSELATQ